MPSWEDLMNCVCQNGPQRPGVQEILDTIQRSTVCTGTQCFETEADAFGLTAAPNAGQGTPTAFWMMITFMMLVAVMMKLKKKTPALTEKPGSSSSHAQEPPAPPPAA